VELASEAHAYKITALRSNLPPGVTVSKGTTPQERSRRRPQQGLFLTLLHEVTITELDMQLDLKQASIPWSTDKPGGVEHMIHTIVHQVLGLEI
jgi:hypothetical protein